MRVLSVVAALALFVMSCGQKKEQPPAARTEPTSVVVPESVKRQAEPAAVPETPKPAPAAVAQPEEPARQLPKLWDFWATWCPPCREQKPIVEELAKEYAGVVEVKSIDVDENKDLAQKFNVQAIPTLVFLDAHGNELSRRIGLFPKDSIVGRFRTHGFIK